MLTKEQADKLRGYVSRYGKTMSDLGKVAVTQNSDEDYKFCVSEKRKASGKVHKYIAECTEKLEPESGKPSEQS